MKNFGTLGSIIDNMRAGGKAPSRHENPYLQQAMELEGTLFTQTRLDDLFATLELSGERPLILEVGCYLGRSLIDFALQHPDINFVGLDITYKRTAITSRRVRAAEADKNAFVTLCAATPFLEAMPQNRLTGTCVFFPDPWPRTRDEKNRLLQKDFFKLLHSRTKSQGFFWLKTDSPAYFQAAQEAAHAGGWRELPDVTSGIQRFLGGKIPAKTVFEELFERKGSAATEGFFVPRPPTLVNDQMDSRENQRSEQQ